MSEIRVTNIVGENGNDAVTFTKGVSVTGVTTATTFSGSGASLTNLPTAQLTGNVPTTKGGTGLTSLGSAGQSLKVNSGGNALEFGTISQKIVAITTVFSVAELPVAL